MAADPDWLGAQKHHARHQHGTGLPSYYTFWTTPSRGASEHYFVDCGGLLEARHRLTPCTNRFGGFGSGRAVEHSGRGCQNGNGSYHEWYNSRSYLHVLLLASKEGGDW